MIQKLSVSLRLKTGIGEKIMANNECRKLPVGIQSFNVIREEGYLYVDKTDMVWKLANQGLKYNFFIRPPGLLRRKERTLRRTENHGFGEGMETVPGYSIRHEPRGSDCK